MKTISSFVARPAGKATRTGMRTAAATAIVSAMLLSTNAAAQFSGGAGTAQAPYLITNATQLSMVRSFVGAEHTDKYFRLANAIDLAGASWTPIGTEANRFTGHLHGGGYKVTGFTGNLFDYNSGAIDSLGVSGGLAGYNEG
ncbi:MAG: hypothetical protein LBG47_00990, partial [Prevotellaceae bacterium]|nr:hypothetical protein [Prevotellaceae bacterium]